MSDGETLPRGVTACHLCQAEPEARRRYGDLGLAEGRHCPICQAPTCRFHLSTVRWRWRADGRVDSARICRACQRSYAHRHWDVANRDWIS